MFSASCSFQVAPAGWLPRDTSATQRSVSPEKGSEPTDDDDDDEDAAAAGGLTLLADALAAIVGGLGAKPHVWALGPASHAIGMLVILHP